MRCGADTGGTFTDIVTDDGRVLKILSTPDDPSRAVADGLARTAEGGRPRLLAHGTTVATNALLERRGGRVALVTTGSGPVAPEGLRAAVSVLELLPTELRATVRDVTVSGANLVTFTVRGKVQVIWGGAGDGPKKLKLLTVLLATNPALVDVSAPDTPVTR